MIAPTSSATAKATVSGALTFTHERTGTVPQEVTVTGKQAGTATVTHAVTSSADSRFPVGMGIGSVAVTVENSAPTFDDGESTTREVAENSAAVVECGQPGGRERRRQRRQR